MRSGRKRRAASTLIRCTLALVADYSFYQEMGGHDRRQSINYMVRQLVYLFLSKSLNAVLAVNFTL